jgi:predicted transglutaminase-like cysteine proteinase
MSNTAMKGLMAALASVMLASPVFAGASMKTGAATTQPVGHYELCQRLPSECAQLAGSARPMVLTPKSWALLQSINNSANASIEPITDQDLWGVPELWSYPTKRGDCEDYVLLKRRQLMAKGVSGHDLLITVVRQANGDGHALLTVRTDRGDFVLDNLEPSILLWTKTPYRFLKRQSVEAPAEWVSINDGRAPMVGSVN